jgi:hypothetical protein
MPPGGRETVFGFGQYWNDRCKKKRIRRSWKRRSLFKKIFPLSFKREGNKGGEVDNCPPNHP